MSFKGAVKDIRKTLETIDIFVGVLNSVEIFLLCYIVLFLFRSKGEYGLIPAFLYFFVFLYFETRRSKIRKVERVYPELNEKLRTAVDNANLENPIANELKEDVSKEIGNVKLSSFVDARAISRRMVTCVVLCFVILILASLNVGINFRIKDIAEFKARFGGSGGGNGTGVEDVIGLGSDTDIYGVESVAKLGDKEIEMVIPPISYELDVNEIYAPEERLFEESPFPTDTFIPQAETFEDKTPEEYAELIKNYFLRITQ